MTFDMVLIESFDLDSLKTHISTVEKVSTVQKGRPQELRPIGLLLTQQI
jgi:hypothetical protein